MEFEWDAAKSEENERRRGLPFALAILLFDGAVLQIVDDRRDYGETRIRAIGSIEGSVLQCVYTDRLKPAGAERRIISLRRASRKERDAYRATFSC